MNEIFTFLEFSVFFTEMKMGKNKFSTSNSVDTTKYLAFRKALLGRLYLKVKVYINNFLSVYNSQKILCLK